MKKVLLLTIFLPLLISNIFAMKKKYLSIPVLCYHHIENKSGTHLDRSNYRISVKQFKKQMNYLRKNGFKTISLDTLHKFIDGHDVRLPAKPVVITFDDGLKSQYRNALPILKKYGFKGVFFIYPSVILAKAGKYKKYYINKKMIKKLHKLGMEVESHSYYHPLMHISPLRDNIVQFKYSKKWLENIIDKKIQYFAYPFGSYTRDTNNLALKYGYKGLFTINNSPVYAGSDVLSINRYMIARNHNLRVFKLYVNARALRITRFNPVNGGRYGKIDYISAKLKDIVSLKKYRVIILLNGVRHKKYFFNHGRKLLFFYPKKVYKGLNIVQIILKSKINTNSTRLIASWSFVYSKKTYLANRKNNKRKQKKKTSTN